MAKTAFAGVVLEIFSARFMASMATFNEDIAFSCPFGRWELVAMVETRCSHKETVGGAAVRKNQDLRDGRGGVHPVIVTCRVRSDLFGGRTRPITRNFLLRLSDSFTMR